MKDKINWIIYDAKKDIMDPHLIDQVAASFFKNFSDKNSSMLYYVDGDDDIKNWIRYKLVGIFAYRNQVSFDGDTTSISRELIKKVYGVEDYLEGVYGRHYKIDDSIYESDTMHSFRTIFLVFIRKILKRIYNKTLVELYTTKYPKGEEYLFLWLLENFDEVKKRSCDIDHIYEDILNEFSLFARLTHTRGNYALVPYCYNMYRGGYQNNLNDCWICGYKKIFEEKEEDLARSVYYYAIENRRVVSLDKILSSIVGYKNKIKHEFDDFSYLETDAYGSLSIKDYNALDDEELLRVVRSINTSIIARAIKISDLSSTLTIEEVKGYIKEKN